MPQVKFDVVTDLSSLQLGVNQANHLMDQLTDKTEAYSKESKEAFGKGAEDVNAYNKQIKYGTKSLEKITDASEQVGTVSKNAFGELKKQLKEAKGELAKFDYGTDQYNAAAEKIQELKDQIGGLDNVSRVSGTSVERLGQSFGLIQEGLLSADFGKAKLGFKELGQAMSGIPFLLLVQGLTFLIQNFDEVVKWVKEVTGWFSAEEKQVRALTAELEKQKQTNIELIGDLDRQIALLEAQGASEEKIIALKKEKIAIQIQEAETSLKLSGAKLLDIKNNNDLYESYLNVVSGIERKLGLDKVADNTDKLYNLNKQERLKDEQKAFIEANENLQNLKNELSIIDAEREKKTADKIKDTRKEMNDFLKQLEQKSNQAELAGLTGKARIEKQKELDDQEYEVFRKALETKGKLLDKNFKFTAQQEAEFAKIKTEINRKYYDELLKLAQEDANKQAQQNKTKVDNELLYLEQRNQINKDTIGAIRIADTSSAMEQKEFELKKQQVLLKNEIIYQNQKLELTKKEIDAEVNLKKSALLAELAILATRDDAVSAARKEAISKQLNLLTQQQQTAEEVADASTKNIITELNDKLKDVNKQLEPHKIDLGKLLTFDSGEISTLLNNVFKGAKFDPGNIDKLKEGIAKLGAALQDLAAQYFQAQEQQLDAELAVNQKRIEARDQNIEDLKSQLQDELAAQQEGNANNVDAIRKRIAAEEAAKQQDLENDRKIKEEKAKLQKQQLIIDTVTQAANLATASTQIFATLSSIPFVGIPLAIATIGAMITAFTVAKAQAFAAVKQGAQFWEGGFVEGKGGYTGDGGKYDPAGTVHKGEFVTTKEDTKKHRTLLEGIHEGNRSKLKEGIANLLADTGVIMSTDLISDIGARKSEQKQAEINAIFHGDNSGVEKRIDALSQEVNKLTQGLKKKVTHLPDGTKIIQEGNNTRIIRKKHEQS